MAEGQAPLVKVVNLPLVQQVTGEELRQSQAALELLLLRMYGVLPEGGTPPEAEECEIAGVSDIFENGTSILATGQSGCNLQAYASACARAATRHRYRCEETCGQFKVINAHRTCRGNSRPTIQPFSVPRHCFHDPQHGPSVACVVTGWCACDP
jgi:hypothetical protein